MYRLLACLFMVHTLTPVAFSQASIAQAGYRVPAPLEVAPNQVVVITTRGLAARPTPYPWVSIPEEELDSVRARVEVEGLSPQPVRLFAIRQEGCSAGQSNCDPLSSITMLMPMTLSPGLQAALVIEDRGRQLQPIPLQIVWDRIHILNSCDVTGISIGLFVPPPSRCTPLVTAGRAVLVTPDNPARPGDTLTVWAYGLGLPEFSGGDPGATPSVRNQVELYFQYGPNAAGGRATGIVGVRPEFAGQFGWLYQVNFKIPELPPATGLPLATEPLPCGSRTQITGRLVESNLTITLAGSASYETARICVAR